MQLSTARIFHAEAGIFTELDEVCLFEAAVLALLSLLLAFL
jgi:hypothetical protein